VLDALDDATPLHAVLLGTAADAAFARAVATATRAPVLDLTGKTGLRDLIAVFERSRAVVGPDSGALHLAAALGRPVVSLWGATSPLRSAPHGSEPRVVAGRTPCAPCFLTRCPIGRVCMQAIEVDAVRELVERALAA
jgi:ADP-heptose:LPS heptosyltransferase